MKIVRKSMLALLLAASVPMTSQAAGIVSTVATASDDIVVSSNAEATVRATGRTDLIAGSYPNNFVLGTWRASVTAGTVAFRLSSLNADGLLSANYGYAVNTTNSSSSVMMGVISTNGATGTIINGWRVMPVGVSSIDDGVIIMIGNQNLVPGSYPVGIDVAAYAH